MRFDFITPEQASKIEASRPIYPVDRPAEQISSAIQSRLEIVADLLNKPGEAVAQTIMGKRLRTARLGSQAVKNYILPAGKPDPDNRGQAQGGITASDRVMLRLDTVGPIVEFRRDPKNNPVITETLEPFDIGLYETYRIVTTPTETKSLVPEEGYLPSGLIVGDQAVEAYFELLQKSEP